MANGKPNISAAAIDTIEKMRIWAVDHDAAIFGFWRVQWRWNKSRDDDLESLEVDMGKRMTKIEGRQGEVERTAAKWAGAMAIAGAILGTLLAAGLSALIRG